MGTHFSTPSMSSRFAPSSFVLSPSTPITVACEPVERFAPRPRSFSSATTAFNILLGASLFHQDNHKKAPLAFITLCFKLVKFIIPVSSAKGKQKSMEK